jgi:Zn-finger nucleic acid-binding protein
MESEVERSFYITLTTLATLSRSDAEPDLVQLLERELGSEEGIEIEWSCVAGAAATQALLEEACISSAFSRTSNKEALMSQVAMDCPKCHIAMFRRRRYGTNAAHCSLCGGIWLSREAVAEALGKTSQGESFNPAADVIPMPGGHESALACPQCSPLALEVRTYRGIEVEWCPRCKGFGFERGELEKILDQLGGAQSGEGGGGGAVVFLLELARNLLEDD